MQVGTWLNERFEIEAIAGRGGMGVVYRAIDHQTKEPVAVKLLTARGPGALQRFARESYILSSLQHPNIVKHIAHGELEDGALFLVMEWLDGEDLSQRLKRGTLSIEEAFVAIRAAAKALAEAHARGIVHRDIKPSNLFLPSGHLGSLKVLDFGIARPAEAELEMTRSGMILGTPGYMAPEQAVRGAKGLEPSADIFALGCVLFECLAGRPAFIGENILAVLSKVLLEEPPPLRSLHADVPEALEVFVALCLSKSPLERPADGAAFLSMLDSLESAPSKNNKPTRAGLTQGEQRLLCVVMVKKEARELAPTIAPGETQTSTLEPLQAEVARFGGQLSPLVDGSLLVVLLGDNAATDLALRAARCALSLRALEPHAPIAVALGRAEVSHHLPVGALIDHTVRLLQAPMQDKIRIDESCAGLLGERFLLHSDEHGLLLSQERTRGASRTLLGRQSPCVGRERELSLLEGAYQHCIEEPCARVTLVLANAGVGKSRLCEEFIERIKHQDVETNTLLLRGQGDPMRAGASFGLLAPALRESAHIYEDEALESAQEKLRARILQSVPPEDAPRIWEFLGELIGVPFPESQSPLLKAARQDAQLMGDQMQLAFEDWLSAEARSHPVVFILEDLHWGDASTIKFIDTSLRQLREQPFFVLALSRPEVRSQFPSLWSTHRVEELRLPELSKKASARLIQSALGDKADAATSAALVERSAGNAFYLEELIRAVHQGKTEQFPETVLAMAQARLEGLSAELRQVLRAASIFGQTCWSGAAGALLENIEVKGLLRELIGQELLGRASKSKFAGEEEYSFRHALLREAAYASLTDQDKRLGHKLAAEWLERSQEKEPLLLAEHFDRGGEPLRAAPYYLNAARQALEGNDLQQTIHLAQRGIACGISDVTLAGLLLIKAEAHNWRSEFHEAEPLALQAMQRFTPRSHDWFHAIAEAILASGRRGNNPLLTSLSKELHDVPWGDLPDLFQLLAYNRAIPRLTINGHFTIAFSLVERLRTLPERLSEPMLNAWLNMSKATIHFTMGHDPSISIMVIEQSIEAFKRLGDLRNAALEMTSLTFIQQFIGVWEEESIREAIAICDLIQLPRVEMTAKLYLARLLQIKNRIPEWRALTEPMLTAACARADHQIEALTRASRAECAMAEGNLKVAEEELLIADERIRPFGVMRGHTLRLLAKVYLQQQRPKEALDTIQEAQAFLPPEHLFGAASNAEAGLRLIYAQALLANERQEEGLRQLRKARARLELRAEKIRDPKLRESFLTNVPENAETLELAAALLA